ncbi:MAG TPA: S1 RNA-binding domain-containing protein [Ignavibacteriales bacterium]|nr:S1 RNA-binding domain-containing protein [Ignavibacteriales bacterium]
MRLKGTVRNIVDFGAFVDIGVKQDALIHISQIADKYVKHPLEVLKVGDIIEATIISIDIPRGRISLSCKENPVKA